MPHQCVRCNTFYEDGAQEILKGCSCGARLFFFVKKDKRKQAEEIALNLSVKEKEQMEKDVRELMGAAPEDDEPVILDVESIKVIKPGKYEIDLVHMFKKDPLIFKLEDGKYLIDLPETFKKAKAGR